MGEHLKRQERLAHTVLERDAADWRGMLLTGEGEGVPHSDGRGPQGDVRTQDPERPDLKRRNILLQL